MGEITDEEIMAVCLEAETLAGGRHMISMLRGEVIVGEFRDRLALLIRAVIAADRNRRPQAGAVADLAKEYGRCVIDHERTPDKYTREQVDEAFGELLAHAAPQPVPGWRMVPEERATTPTTKE